MSSVRTEKLLASMCDESTIDLAEHAARIAAVVENGKLCHAPPPFAVERDLISDLHRGLRPVS